MKYPVHPLFLGCAFLAVPAYAVPVPQFAAGKPFPELVFPLLKDGSAASLTQLRGQKVVLHIFASW